jgi:hypothetical protein
MPGSNRRHPPCKGGALPSYTFDFIGFKDERDNVQKRLIALPILYKKIRVSRLRVGLISAPLMPLGRPVALAATEDITMGLLNRLNKQAVELWLRHANCKNQEQKDVLLKQYKSVFSQYLKHKEWLKVMAL